MSPLIIILILLKVDLKQPREYKLQEVILAHGHIALAGHSLSLPVLFILGESGPKLESLCPDLVAVRVGSSSGHLANLFEVDLHRVVLEGAHLLESV